jgi:hypothetical protein
MLSLGKNFIKLFKRLGLERRNGATPQNCTRKNQTSSRPDSMRQTILSRTYKRRSTLQG